MVSQLSNYLHRWSRYHTLPSANLRWYLFANEEKNIRTIRSITVTVFVYRHRVSLRRLDPLEVQQPPLRRAMLD